jgi:hypothetical protein
VPSHLANFSIGREKSLSGLTHSFHISVYVAERVLVLKYDELFGVRHEATSNHYMQNVYTMSEII